MSARVVTLAFNGVEAVPVDVQVQFTGGEAKFFLVGMGDKAISESRERVRAAFSGLGLALPARRIIANLAPADLPKEGSHYDLPIALAIMAGMGVIPPDALEGWAAVGELSLDGRITPVAGALPAAVAAGGMGLGLICPEACGPEAAWAGARSSHSARLTSSLSMPPPLRLGTLDAHADRVGAVRRELRAAPGTRAVDADRHHRGDVLDGRAVAGTRHHHAAPRGADLLRGVGARPGRVRGRVPPHR